MFKILRIICAVLSAAILVIIVPAVVWWPKIYILILAVLSLLFFVLMMLFKSMQESRGPTHDEQTAAPASNEDATSTEQSGNDHEYK